MVINADQESRTDGTAYNFVCSLKSNVPIVLVAWTEDFKFNEDLRKIKDYILIDFCEYGYNHDFGPYGSHVWGDNSDKFPRYYTGDWIKFDKWVEENPPKVFFKRELLKQDASDWLRPIEYPCVFEVTQPQTKEQFLKRPIQVFNYWGRSNEERLRVHGEFWINGYRMGWAVCDNIYYLQKFLEEESNPKKFATFNIPHYARIEMAQIITINGLSKISMSLSGAGKKCFRHSESPVNSIMAMERSGMAWSFDWDETNSIQFNVKEELEHCTTALYSEDWLYDIYRKGIDNCRNYQLPDYTKHIETIIANAL